MEQGSVLRIRSIPLGVLPVGLHSVISPYEDKWLGRSPIAHRSRLPPRRRASIKEPPATWAPPKPLPFKAGPFKAGPFKAGPFKAGPSQVQLLGKSACAWSAYARRAYRATRAIPAASAATLPWCATAPA